MTDENNQKEHSAVVKNRKSAQLSGISEVSAYDEQCINAVSECGAFAVYGSALRIISFDQRSGLLSIGGNIDSIVYARKSSAEKGFFARLLK